MQNSKSVLENIQNMVNGQGVSEDIMDILYTHKCYYLLDQLPYSHRYKELIQEKIKVNRAKVDKRYNACKNIFNYLEKQNILYAVIKGAVLSKSLFNDLYYRSSSDIDILIDQEHASTLKKLLIENGFIQGKVVDNRVQPFSREEILFYASQTHQLAPFVKVDEGIHIHVDVNFDILWGECKERVDLKLVLSNTERTNVCGIEIHKLDWEMEFIALCLHHYKDMNSIYLLSQKSLTLDLFCDIYLFMKRVKMDKDKLYLLCYKLKVIDYVYYCVHCTNDIFADATVREYQTILYTPKGEELLEYYGLAKAEKRKWEISLEERLFTINLEEYFRKILSDDCLKKIDINTHLL